MFEISKLKSNRRNYAKLKYMENCLDKTGLVSSIIHTKTEAYIEFYKGDSPTAYLFIDGNEILLMENSSSVVEGNIEKVLYIVNMYVEEMNTKY